MNISSKYKFIINVVYYVLLALLIFLFSKFLFSYLFPFLIGIIITVCVQKPASIVSVRLNVKKGYCALTFVILIYIILIGLISLLVFWIGNYFYTLSIGEDSLLKAITNYSENFINSLNELFDTLPDFVSIQLDNLFKTLLSNLIELFTDFAKGLVKSAPMFLTSTVVTIIASCYIAKDYDRFKISIYSVLTNKYKLAIRETKKLLKENVVKVAFGYLKILTITFTELALGLMLLRVKHALLYAVIIAILDLLPILGTGTILVPWSIYAILSTDYIFGAGLLILYIVIMLVRNIIEPKIIGKQMGLHPLIALIAVFIGLKFLGFAGIFVLPFLTMLIYKMYDCGIFDILFNKENKKTTSYS